ncbi:MAG: hypothetical protein AABZ64_14875 [Nitrospinota bacterium]
MNVLPKTRRIQTLQGLKELENLKAALSLYFAWYNFGRVHRTLRVTTAMETGIADHLWEMQEIVAL